LKRKKGGQRGKNGWGPDYVSEKLKEAGFPKSIGHQANAKSKRKGLSETKRGGRKGGTGGWGKGSKWEQLK